MERINPMIITIGDKEYTLEFSRKTAKMAEAGGFKREDVADKLMTRIPELFYYAFKMHHSDIKRETTDKILFEDLEGLTESELDKLVALFNAPYETLINSNGERKNGRVTVR